MILLHTRRKFDGIKKCEPRAFSLFLMQERLSQQSVQSFVEA